MTNDEARRELAYMLRVSLLSSRERRWRGPILRAHQWALIKAIRAIDKVRGLERLGIRIHPGKKV